MDPQNLNTDTYVIAVDNTSKKADLKSTYPFGTNVIIRNESDKAVFVKSSENGSDTIVFPTSASVSIQGQIILPGTAETFLFNNHERYIYAIQESAGTGSLFITAGKGL